MTTINDRAFADLIQYIVTENDRYFKRAKILLDSHDSNSQYRQNDIQFFLGGSQALCDLIVKMDTLGILPSEQFVDAVKPCKREG